MVFKTYFEGLIAQILTKKDRLLVLNKTQESKAFEITFSQNIAIDIIAIN